MIQTELCTMLHIRYPIFQGAMAWIADARLASAVSNAGGLGIIAAGNAPASYVKEEIRKAREWTEQPFGLNIMLMSPFAQEVAELAVQERVAVVTTGAGLPTKYMPKWLEAGIKVIPVVPSTGIAKLVQRAGAAAVIAEGGEAGGHIGELTTMALVPQVADAVSIPVIAAGGIADGRGVAASFMLGASGVQLGTRFLTAKECHIHPQYKDKIIKSKDIDTITTGKRLGHPVRSLKTPFSRKYFQMEYDSTVSNAELEAMGSGALRLAVQEGDLESGCFMAGQSCAMVTKEQTVKEMIEEIFQETESILGGAGRWVK